MSTSPDPWTQLAVNVAITTFTHPMGYVKTLIQVGFEPIPPKIGKNLFFRKTLLLPGFFQYVGHIRKVDGFFGLYRGVGARIFASVSGNLVARITSQKLEEHFPSQESENTESKKGAKLTTNEFLTESAKLTVSHCCAAVVSHPFQVIAVRSMVQFIGREIKYNGFIAPFREVYNENGIMGFFAGLVPRVLMDVLTLWLARTMFHIFNNYILDDNMSNAKEVRSYMHAITGFVAGMMTYPLGLVSTLMTVNESGLAAGSPPFTPVYPTWRDCWSDLSERGLLKRGSSLFFRPYQANAVAIEAHPMTPLD
ncbi:mitochondrial carrier homolog 2-like [Apostichopus japonicus]|uniref:mitochondrial carrier homolog 2-like n=1 Tax=Stichopus japonicus TaxID=307972 RepID=UPI003AB1D505